MDSTRSPAASPKCTAPPPKLESCASAEAETQLIATTVTQWVNDGIAPAEIGIAVRTHWFTPKVERALKAAGIRTVELAKAADDDDAVRNGTMHRMKGLEFRCICVAGVGAKLVPAANTVTAIEDDKQTHQQELGAGALSAVRGVPVRANDSSSPGTASPACS